MTASTRTASFERVLYAVNKAGAAWYRPTIGTNDSPDLSDATDKASAVTQCALNSPEGEEVVA